ncbi:hypothetical protein BH23ACT9_BH23ACT9_24640 [soil metagenome]
MSAPSLSRGSVGRRGTMIGWGIAAAIALLAPLVANERQVFVMMSILILAVFATSYNVLLGWTGMVSFAHAAYYGVGTYTVTLLWFHLGLSPLIGFLLAPLVAGAIGFLTGLVALRATRLYFALLTLAIGQLLFLITFQWRDLTRGDDGIHGMRLPVFLTGTTPRYYALLVLTVVALTILAVALHSPFGATLRAIRENRDRAGFLGIRVKRYELGAFTLGSAFAGWAGGMYALFDRSSFPLLLNWTTSADPIFVTLIGGLNSFAGPAVGAVIYALLRDYVTRNFVYFAAVLGVVLLSIILFMPGGTVEAVQRLSARLRGRRPPHTTTSEPEVHIATEPEATEPEEVRS